MRTCLEEIALYSGASPWRHERSQVGSPPLLSNDSSSMALEPLPKVTGNAGPLKLHSTGDTRRGRTNAARSEGPPLLSNDSSSMALEALPESHWKRWAAEREALHGLCSWFIAPLLYKPVVWREELVSATLASQLAPPHQPQPHTLCWRVEASPRPMG